MTHSSTSALAFQLRQKLEIKATIVFDTAWRIGSGQEGETMSDLGVVLDPTGQPILPGSSLKGKLRSSSEMLAHALDLTACMLNHEASKVNCVSDVDYYHQVRNEYRDAMNNGLEDRLEWIDQHTCDVCKLFGSPVQASRIRITEGRLVEWAEIVQVRDGVVIDRDSQTAVDGLKYDYEVIPPGSRFEVEIDLENPTDADLALVGAALFDWYGGNALGGGTSRGLGRFHLENVTIAGIDLTDPKQRVRFLTATKSGDRLTDLGDWESYFSSYIEQRA